MAYVLLFDQSDGGGAGAGRSLCRHLGKCRAVGRVRSNCGGSKPRLFPPLRSAGMAHDGQDAQETKKYEAARRGTCVMKNDLTTKHPARPIRRGGQPNRSKRK